ncbi:hypothetical protein SAMN05216276_1003136 [Streptosporangium subroseum]|uniref:Uncharacterized protein n=1 Tax=Streptosporangium subroseum TaxID=106412 RepID=A0A239BDY0_9ACTN|nr:hypothetical protein [Streptosporangium subroseum]SNS05949.1 hypothetical protein SAMN05216276_1003136 [Streptosporangium subroseum]
MIPRSSMAPVVASGAANVVKLLVATLAFTGAYVGVEASQNASVRARLGVDAEAPVHTVALSAGSLPAVTRSDITKPVVTGAATAEKIPTVGTVTVSAVTALGACDKPYRIQSVIGNAHPEKAVSYGWGLQRWSPSTRSWRPYLSRHSGFIGKSQTVKWEPRVVDNPGWYRAVLSVSGDAPLRSEKFLVRC